MDRLQKDDGQTARGSRQMQLPLADTSTLVVSDGSIVL